MTPQEVLDAANGDVKNLGRISQADAITWFKLANNKLPKEAIVGSITLSLLTDIRNYSLASGTGFIKVLEMRDADDEEYRHNYRIRDIAGGKTLIFECKPSKVQTITVYFAKQPTTITATNFDSLELEIDQDFQDVYIYYLQYRFYKKMLETELAVMSKMEFDNRVSDLKTAIKERWHAGYPRRVRAMYYV